jgi:hypothetical protein
MNRIAAVTGLLPAIVVITSLGACLYDPDDPCSLHQELKDGVCVCVAGAVPDGNGGGCTPCGAHEVATGLACTCAEGYVRVDEAGACELLPAGLGEPCDTGGLACADSVYDFCRATDATSGYCTSTGCETSADCPSLHACEQDDAVRFCERPPTGQGMACTSSDDCAGLEASYCETFQAHICLVPDCTLEPDSCHEGWECCDLSSLGLDETLCVVAGQCPT